MSSNEDRICLTCTVKYSPEHDKCPTDGTPLSVVPGHSLEGTVFAEKYKLLERLGAGGMSVVYKAEHLLMNKVVALKLLQAHLATKPETVLRFQQEARAIGTLNHPSIVAVQDFGVTESGEPYLVMELLEGATLQQILEKEGRMGAEEFIPLSKQILDALSHAHERGIVHRDIKPSNVILVGDRPNATAKIVDFGIAKLLDDEGANNLRLTRTGEMHGSPLYMSPEQCSLQPLDTRSDIYSLGCLMYECLTGKPPHQGKSAYETFDKHIKEPTPTFREIAPNTVLSDALEDAVLKALEKEPGKRHQTADEFKDSLEKTAEMTGRSLLPRNWRRTLARFLQPKRNMTARERARQKFQMLGIYALIAVVLLLFVPPFSTHFRGSIEGLQWIYWDHKGFATLREARRLEESGDNVAAKTLYEQAKHELEMVKDSVSNYGLKDRPDLRWRKQRLHSHLAKVYSALGMQQEAKASAQIAEELAPKIVPTDE